MMTSHPLTVSCKMVMDEREKAITGPQQCKAFITVTPAEFKTTNYK